MLVIWFLSPWRDTEGLRFFSGGGGGGVTGVGGEWPTRRDGSKLWRLVLGRVSMYGVSDVDISYCDYLREAGRSGMQVRR